MYVVCVTVKVKPGKGEAFLVVAHRNRVGTRKEPGNLRFDVLRGAHLTEPGQPEEFLLFEVYRTAEDFPAHQRTAHYLQFRDDAADLMAEPRQGIPYHVVDADPWE